MDDKIKLSIYESNSNEFVMKDITIDESELSHKIDILKEIYNSENYSLVITGEERFVSFSIVKETNLIVQKYYDNKHLLF